MRCLDSPLPHASCCLATCLRSAGSCQKSAKTPEHRSHPPPEPVELSLPTLAVAASLETQPVLGDLIAFLGDAYCFQPGSNHVTKSRFSRWRLLATATPYQRSRLRNVAGSSAVLACPQHQFMLIVGKVVSQASPKMPVVTPDSVKLVRSAEQSTGFPVTVFVHVHPVDLLPTESSTVNVTVMIVSEPAQANSTVAVTRNRNGATIHCS